MLRGARLRHPAWSMGGLRAMLRHWAGCGLPLTKAKAPLTVARHLFHFGREPWRWGSGPFALRCGVGRGKWRLHCWVCTRLRKIRIRFRECKHTSLILLVGKSLKLSIVPVLCGTVSYVILETPRTYNVCAVSSQLAEMLRKTINMSKKRR